VALAVAGKIMTIEPQMRRTYVKMRVFAFAIVPFGTFSWFSRKKGTS